MVEVDVCKDVDSELDAVDGEQPALFRVGAKAERCALLTFAVGRRAAQPRAVCHRIARGIQEAGSSSLRPFDGATVLCDACHSWGGSRCGGEGRCPARWIGVIVVEVDVCKDVNPPFNAVDGKQPALFGVGSKAERSAHHAFAVGQSVAHHCAGCH